MNVIIIVILVITEHNRAVCHGAVSSTVVLGHNTFLRAYARVCSRGLYPRAELCVCVCVSTHV